MAATSATKEPPLSVEILMDSDCVGTNEDQDLSTVVLADKGKGVDPREYGSSLYNPKLMIAQADTTSPGGSDVIELVGVHRDRGKNADPEETRNSMANYDPRPYNALDADVALDADGALSKARHLMTQVSQLLLLESFKSTKLTGKITDVQFYWNNADPEETVEIGLAKDKPGPSRIDFDDNEEGYIWMPCPSRVDFHYSRGIFVWKKSITLESLKPTKPTDLDDGLPCDPTLPLPRWHPKISPYRFAVFLTPLAIGTFKAVLSYKGSVTTPITLEWINGLVFFLL